MNSIRSKIAIFILIVELLSACGGQATASPAPPSTDTAAPTDTAQATEILSTQPVFEQNPQGATVRFAYDVFPIIQSRCINCHGGDRTEEGLVMLTYADSMAGSDNGPVVTPGDAVNSLMAELVSEQKMPKRGPKLTPPQVQVIIDWINQGALNN